MSEIEVVMANPRWVEEYTALACQIRSTVDDDAIRVDHIGSTAVNGLAAKDVIDIQISVENLSKETVTSKLVDIGYRLHDNAKDNLIGFSQGSPELRKQFLSEPKNQRRTNVHIRQIGRLNQEYPLLFRDFLRNDPFMTHAYQQIKLELAMRFPNDIDSYYAIKDPYMDTLYRAAQSWAESVNWKPSNDFL